MRNLVLIFVFWTITLLIACGDGNVTVLEDPSIQAAEDSATIVNYLADLGYTGDDVGVLESGVRYVILDSGDMESIDESDIVTFNYAGRLTNDTIFDTSIKEVADSIRLAVESNIQGDTSDIEFTLLSTFSDNRVYSPFIYTYSANGWPFEGQFIDGFSEGISATFNKLKVGGTSLIAIPSAQGYGTTGSGLLIQPDEVLIFELYPIEVIKQ